MTRYRGLLVMTIVLAALCVEGDVWAGPPTEQLKASIDRVVKALEDPVLKGEGKVLDRRMRVRSIANDIFDFGETARRSLGRHWLARTPTEQAEFVELFSDLLERSYLSKIELYGGEKIQYLSDTIDDAGQAKVLTKIVTRQGTEIPIEYRMHKKGERWLVYDVIIESVSLVSNYRTQFNKIIQTSSYQELVKKMRAKQEEFQYEESAKQKRALRG